MPKEFYTEKDIEDLVKRGILTLEVNDNVALTDLAYEKANRLGVKLVQARPDTPPAAPVRPYVSQPARSAAVLPASAAPASSRPADGDLHGRIRSAVIARLGNQVDPALLDVIIQRVLKSTGVK
jgi:hypothetical protein